MSGVQGVMGWLPELNSLSGALLVALAVYLLGLCVSQLAGPPLARALLGDGKRRGPKRPPP